MKANRSYIDILLLFIAFISLTEGSTLPKPKRQIYREQVLPSSGGKIPDGAFATDRLALNRLNKAGISVPDGVLLDHRHVYSHPHSNQHDPEDEDSLVKLVQRPENRFVASVGVYRNEKPLTVSSTYIIRKPTHTTNIKTPNQQMPLHELLASKEMGDVFGAYPALTFHTPGWKPFRFEDSITPTYFSPTTIPAPYQEIKQSVAYYPVTVPLEIPNKSLQKVRHPQGGSVRYHETEDVHKIFDWPYLLREYTRLAEEINTISQSPYENPAQHALFFTPEVVAPLDSYYYGTRGRYARKSKEISFTDLTSGKVRSKDTGGVIKLRCTVGTEKTLDGHDTKCRLRY